MAEWCSTALRVRGHFVRGKMARTLVGVCMGRTGPRLGLQFQRFSNMCIDLDEPFLFPGRRDAEEVESRYCIRFGLETGYAEGDAASCM